jgi:hypothetical protein
VAVTGIPIDVSSGLRAQPAEQLDGQVGQDERQVLS